MNAIVQKLSTKPLAWVSSIDPNPSGCFYVLSICSFLSIKC